MLEGDPYPGTFRFMLARNPMSPVRDPILDKINIYFVFRYHSHFLYGLDSFIQYFKKEQSIAKTDHFFVETIIKLVFVSGIQVNGSKSRLTLKWGQLMDRCLMWCSSEQIRHVQGSTSTFLVNRVFLFLGANFENCKFKQQSWKTEVINAANNGWRAPSS